MVDSRPSDTRDRTPAASLAAPALNSGATLAAWILLGLVGLALLASFWVVVPAGERGVWMRFGRVQEKILAEGLHFVVPLVDSVETLSTRVQKQEVATEAASKDLQDVFSDVALNWHILPDKANVVFQQVGDEADIVRSLVNPAIEEVIKAVMAHYTAEEVITQRDRVKAEVDAGLRSRLAPYNLAVDDVSLTTIHFSQQFRDAVEAKQIAVQEAKQAEFVAKKALRQAEIEINLARGTAEAHQILQETLTPSVLKYEALQKWDGRLPMITGEGTSTVVELDDLVPDRG
ncbi:prohibitin family protein [Nodosilinea sp. LEGE 06152]|uniref:prohibitin family protein n=1 Tax=Nodosilinea sp. LEGE 06152 TaxID=2777966 RepID=UPI00187EDF4A|nr:prohibitin family protein [Nodosilinea sp. LEGE 06152]MBE9160440.1 prohibitin family protein [Nodosilinea sp. LEGE 06152]